MSSQKIRRRTPDCQYDWTQMSTQKRIYRKTRRAELEELTRLRITESAVALHEEIGPAQTSISGIADRAGVRRSTVYRHFPDEEALFAACSSHWRAAEPAAGPALVVGDRRPGRANARRSSRAVRVLRRHAGDARQPPARRAARAGGRAPAARLPPLPSRHRGQPRRGPRPAWPARALDPGRNRSRARVSDLALARPRSGSRHRRRGRADVPARRGRGKFRSRLKACGPSTDGGLVPSGRRSRARRRGRRRRARWRAPLRARARGSGRCRCSSSSTASGSSATHSAEPMQVSGIDDHVYEHDGASSGEGVGRYRRVGGGDELASLAQARRSVEQEHAGGRAGRVATDDEPVVVVATRPPRRRRRPAGCGDGRCR